MTGRRCRKFDRQSWRNERKDESDEQGNKESWGFMERILNDYKNLSKQSSHDNSWLPINSIMMKEREEVWQDGHHHYL